MKKLVFFTAALLLTGMILGSCDDRENRKETDPTATGNPENRDDDNYRTNPNNKGAGGNGENNSNNTGPTGTTGTTGTGTK